MSSLRLFLPARAHARRGMCVALVSSVLATAPAWAQTAPAPAPAPAVAPAPAPPPAQAPPPAAAPAPAPAPAAAQPSPFTGQPSPNPNYGYAPPPPAPPAAAPAADAAAEQAEPAKKGKFVPLSVFRFGYGAYSSGSIDTKGQCAGNCPFARRNGSEAVDDTTRALLGFDLMFGPEPISIGFGFWFTTGTTLETDKHVLPIGWEFATPFLLGAVVPVADEVAIRFGAFGGPEFLFAGGGSAQGRDGDAYEALCDDLGGQVGNCDTSSPTRFSWIYGFHAGPVFRLSRVNTLGAELLVQRVDIGLFDVDAEGSGWRAEQSYDYSAWKLWLMLSVGLGK